MLLTMKLYFKSECSLYSSNIVKRYPDIDSKGLQVRRVRFHFRRRGRVGNAPLPGSARQRYRWPSHRNGLPEVECLPFLTILLRCTRNWAIFSLAQSRPYSTTRAAKALREKYQPAENSKQAKAGLPILCKLLSRRACLEHLHLPIRGSA